MFEKHACGGHKWLLIGTYHKKLNGVSQLFHCNAKHSGVCAASRHCEGGQTKQADQASAFKIGPKNDSANSPKSGEFAAIAFDNRQPRYMHHGSKDIDTRTCV